MRNKHHPKCPHCEYEFDDEETWYSDYSESGKVYTGDGDESTLICPNDDCKKSFTVMCSHVIAFESLDVIGDDE